MSSALPNSKLSLYPQPAFAMPRITALIHTRNDALRIGRAIESLRPCDEVLVIDHGSTDDTVKVARHHGATVKDGVLGVDHGVYAVDARHDWVLCLLPHESLSEGLEAALYEWKDLAHEDASGFRVGIREEAQSGNWHTLEPELRLVNRTCVNWPGDVPSDVPGAPLLSGDLLRFKNP